MDGCISPEGIRFVGGASKRRKRPVPTKAEKLVYPLVPAMPAARIAALWRPRLVIPLDGATDKF